MRRNITIMITLLAVFGLSARAHAFDLGKVIGSGLGGIQQMAEASKDITPSEEHYIGRAVAALVLEKYPLLNNSALDNYLNEVGLTVAYHSDRPETYGGWHFAVLNSDEINAFACPGGFIFVTKGLLKEVQNEDQLATVLGHEVTHVAERHGIKAIKKSRWTNFAFYAVGEAGGQVARNYTSAEISQLVDVFQSVVLDVAKNVMEKGYSKADEKEADNLGMRYAANAGYDPLAMAQFIKVEMEKGTGKTGAFSSHPTHEQRLNEVEATIQSQGLTGSVASVRTDRFKQSVASLL
ncbi:MAG: M48 family metalloprotease [Pseudomonadota bacterium]